MPFLFTIGNIHGIMFTYRTKHKARFTNERQEL